MNGHANASNDSTLPATKPITESARTTLQPPLSRRGHGPGLVLIVPDDIDLSPSDKTLDPPPLQKWAEEGFAVAQIKLGTKLSPGSFEDGIREAISALGRLEECDSVDRLGLISYNVPTPDEASDVLDSIGEIVAVVSYGDHVITCSKPQLRHVTDSSIERVKPEQSNITTYNYPKAGSNFVIPSHTDFQSSLAAISHTRCLTFLKPLIGGPYFDIEAVWEEHTQFEFGERDVEKTMATMVQEPYVNHIPTMTGGVGRDRLTNFYRHHFIFNNPDDTNLELVSRTVGIDRVIDEFNFRFTHDRQIDWLLPGVPPTGKYVEVPFTSIVNVRGDRLYHEHIAWDGATLLRQLGLMPEYLPFPYALPDGKTPAPGRRFEFRVPTAGIETASKLRDESAVESNKMFKFTIREVDSD